MIGQIVGNYEVVAKIGEGGMGSVYKGVDLMLEREVAIKALRPELGNQPQIVERFRSEAVTLAKLNHPNIATLFSFFRQGDFFFMVMEFVRGVTVDNLMGPNGRMSCEQAIPLFCQALEGIDHAHRFGIIHRDIKPSNIMLTDSGLVKVLDFGIARVLGTSRLTKAGGLIGTIEYMSPEQVRGLETDARSDIYSLGMLLYELLTGRVPFTSENEFELMRAQVEQPPPPPRTFAPDIPEDVEWAIMCATEKDPSKRFQTAAAFRSAIMNSMGALSNVPKMALPLSVPAIAPVGSISVPPADEIAISPSSLPDARTTGPMSNPSIYADPASANGNQTPVSNPSFSSNPEPGSIQATRLAAGSIPVSSGGVAGPASGEVIRGTRLAETATVRLPGQSGAGPSSLASSPSFLSELTWKHYAGAGVAAVFLLILLIVIPVGIWMSGSAAGGKAAEQPSAGGSQAAKPAAEQPVARPTETPELIQSGGAPSGPATGQNPGVPFIPPQPEETPKSGQQREQRDRAASKPRQPQRSSDSGQSSAERDKARRRSEALKALDQ